MTNEDWWGKWGKCAAAIVGGLLAGFFTGVAAAEAVVDVIPVLDAAGCGAIGSFGGVLAAAAAVC